MRRINKRITLPILFILLTAKLIHAQPGLEAYDRGDLEAVRAYVTSGRGVGAEADFLRAALTADGDSAAEMYRQVAIKYPEWPIGNRALKRLHDYYYAKGLYTRADEVVKNPGSLITPVRQTDSKDTSAVKPSPPTKPDTVNIVTDSELLSSSELSGYALQLGSFANHENVRKLKLKLEKAGYTVALGEVIISGKHLQSVRAVGFKDKDAALAAAGELKKKYGLNPVLLPPSNSQ